MLAGVESGDRGKAAECVMEELTESAKRQRPDYPAQVREDAVGEALYRLLVRLDKEPLRTTHEAGARSYLRMVVRSVLVDEERRRKRLRAADETEELVAPVPEESHDELLAQARGLGTRLLEEAIRRFPRARASLKQSFAEIVALADGEVTVVTLVGGADVPDELRRRNALYKRHERTRRRLLETLRALEAEGKLDAYQARLARSYLLFLGAGTKELER